MGEEWYTWQKKPFVFAAWMTLNPDQKNLIKILQESLDKGLKNIDVIIADIPKPPSPPYQGGKSESPPLIRGGREGLREYFTKNIHYTMEELELEGIRQFYKLLKPLQGYSHELDFKFVS